MCLAGTHFDTQRQEALQAVDYWSKARRTTNNLTIQQENENENELPPSPTPSVYSMHSKKSSNTVTSNNANNINNKIESSQQPQQQQQQQQQGINHFIVLFYHSKSLSYRGIYIKDPTSLEIKRIIGRGPKILNETNIEAFYKYESSSRSFKQIQTNALTSTIDAVSIDPSKFKKY